MKVAILDDYQNVVKDLDSMRLLSGHDVLVLCDQMTQEDKIMALKDRDAIVLIRERTQIDDAFLSSLPNLKVISQTGKISNHIDVSACERHKITILEGVGSPVAPAELCWALVMAASRHIVPYTNHLKEGRWQSSGSLGLGRRLDGLIFGIWGYGKIGQRIADYAKAFGMKVMVWGSEASRDKALGEGCLAAQSKADFFRTCDIISLHLRLHESTKACVSLEDLESMKRDALFVNISRAELIEQNALYQALIKGQPGYAALDVFEQEPVDLESEPLLSLENVLATPHLGYVEKSSYELYFKTAFENLVNFSRDAQQT